MSLTRDSILRGALVLEQPRRGYRFTSDPLLLAGFMSLHGRRPRTGGLSLCDLGAGCGVLGLALLVRVPQATLVAVELQARLAELARSNVARNGLAGRAQVLELDLADPRAARRLPGGRFDWAVSNPPYQPLGRGHVNPDVEAAIARHELRLPLPRLCAELRRALVPLGQAAVIYPASRLDELCTVANREKLATRIVQPIASREGEPANRVMVLFEKGRAPGGMKLLAPLVEHDADGAPSTALRCATEGA